MLDIEYLNLPPIPEYLLDPIEEIIGRPLVIDPAIPEDQFQSKHVSDELVNYLRSIFNFEIIVRYQIIYKGIKMHIDANDRKVAYNYLLSAGGDDVYTNIYDSNRKLIQSEKIMLKKWHRLNTGKLHDVRGINTVRVSVSVTPRRQ